MPKLNNIIAHSGKSAFYRWLLNFALRRIVPFNGPHGLRILHIQPGTATVLLPYKKKNLNHIHGIHACALATLCEYTIGLSLVSRLGEEEYRFIMKRLSMEYHYQAKSEVSATFNLEEKVFLQDIKEPLQEQDATFVNFEIEVQDASGNHICTGRTEWQIKKWEKVKVKS